MLGFSLKTTSRIAVVAAAVIIALVSRPQPGSSQTALEAYQQCMTEAAVAANNCYGTSDGYWATKACDWGWDINRAACLRALARAVVI